MRSSLEAQFKATMMAKQREVLLEYIRENPNLSIGELVGLKGEYGDAVKSITVGEVMGGAVPGRSRRGASSSDAADVGTRTKAGRVAYDDKMLETLQNSEESMSAVELRNAVGGTPDQARKSLNRLIEAGKVGYSGKARGMRYFVE